ncbi:MAG TPA: hypothetical protein VNZ01_13550 [Solirubrobacteraceae bacterium]|nr:hypothetical protein [Solirubrobacteraceae bacterium]
MSVEVDRTHGVRNVLAARAALAGLLAVLVLAVSASAASAVIVHLGNGTTLSYLPAPGTAPSTSSSPLSGSAAAPFDAFFKNLDYNGGPVMTSNTNYTFYWRPNTAPAYPAGFTTGVNTYFEDLQHDSGGHQNVDSVAAQYNDATGSFAEYNSKFAGQLIDEHAYPVSGCTRATICLTDGQIKTELAKYIGENALPTGLGVEYFVLTPEGVESCFEPAGLHCSANAKEHREFCAYHSWVEAESPIVYSNDPFVNGKECDVPTHHINGPSDSALFGGLSHEHNESITDPEPNSAWTDFGGSGKITGYENGDKCRTFAEESEFGTPLGEVAGHTYNQEINGHKYWYQQEWSNKGHTCLQRLNFSPSEAPTANFAIGSISGNTVEFNTAGSTPGSHYAWQFNDVGGEPKTIETTELTINHTFPFPAPFPVALTVFKADGTSRGFSELVSPIREPQTVAFTSAAPGSAKVGGPTYNATAAASSGLPVTLTIDASSTTVCTIAGATVSFLGAGTCRVDANQPGNGLTEPAPQVTQAISVIAPSAPVVPVSPVPVAGAAAAEPLPAPSSNFTLPSATANGATGVITLTVTIRNPGTFSWLLTFRNGKFGVYAASSHRCKTGFIRLGGKCRPANVVYARGSHFAPAAGTVTFAFKPSASALKALKKALKQKKGLPVTATFTFQSARGGSPVTHTQTMTVKLKKR